jgi:hypothetical protein
MGAHIGGPTSGRTCCHNTPKSVGVLGDMMGYGTSANIVLYSDYILQDLLATVMQNRTVQCRTAINTLFRYFNWYLSVQLNSHSYKMI